ncbi:variant erythrocyte surface antigen beta subunit, putative [Babesia ovis]|uniref:Variant erythrocyte surface antigen beta subunit, putative n=1 Tax=Babesia ovis TaxID=5869 RepID=A0A9W5TE29_BABOV|nr:variant erythrocyte surface antigen beta subunit, putative [Babesia ovis]
MNEILAACSKGSNGVPIHDLYANTLFEFRFPMSETQSYYLLQDCLVALYYQMTSNAGDGFGWAFCRYGEGVECTDCKSWICPEAVKKGQEYKAKNGRGTFKDLEQTDCGNGSGKASPLQAFLTDCLKGFTCPVLVDGTSGKKYQENLMELNEKSKLDDYQKCYPDFRTHSTHCPILGQECAVPMGFSGSFGGAKGTASGSKDGMIGLGIRGILEYYTNSNISNASLYQIVRCICSLTRRVPRSTGTIFGFFYGLGQVAFHRKKSDGSNDYTFKNALEGEMGRCPGWREPSCLLDAIKAFAENDHDNTHNKKEKEGYITLGSLVECDRASVTCGNYLRPLTGYLYNSVSDRFCETYVSWIVHLTWRLRDGLESLLKEFRNINCQEAGCKGKSGSSSSSHCCTKDQEHKDCKCANVVECVGVHGLFYRFGFTFYSASYLAGKNTKPGGKKGEEKRTCQNFYQQLDNVIKGPLFSILLTQIRAFFYSTRALFGVYIGVYWLAVMGYLVYSMTVNLDLLHLRSHWRSPRSYLVPLQRLLADNKVKGFCTIGYFQEANGDSLLSQGVSDVYL